MKAILRNTLYATLVAAAGVLTPQSSVADNLQAQTQQAIMNFKQKYPNLTGYFQKSAGYVVFPDVGQGALIVGGTHGKGILYENGKPVGEATLTKASIGAQAGGQAFSEIIFFETPQLIKEFKSGNYAFSASASAVAGTAASGSELDYKDGVKVFTLDRSGLMAKASIGGQTFGYQPLNLAPTGRDTETQTAPNPVQPTPAPPLAPSTK